MTTNVWNDANLIEVIFNLLDFIFLSTETSDWPDVFLKTCLGIYWVCFICGLGRSHMFCICFISLLIGVSVYKLFFLEVHESLSLIDGISQQEEL